MDKIYLKTEDNINIAINHYKTGAKAVLIIAPGWFMTKDSKYFKAIAESFLDKLDVIVMDFRGHGNSSGMYTFTAKETIDMRTVVAYAKNRYRKIYLMGFSLGGALVVIHSAIHQNVDRVIAVSAPHSFSKIENYAWKKEAWLQTFKKFELERWLSVRPCIPMTRMIRPIDVVKKIKAPTLFIAGEKDPTVCAWHTKSLYDAATCEKRYELFENCYHAEDIFLQDRAEFVSACKDWLYRDIVVSPERELYVAVH